MKNKNAVSPIIVTALLLTITVLSVVGFQNWYQTYSSITFTNIGQKSNINSQLKIETIINEKLYLKSETQETLKAFKIISENGTELCEYNLNSITTNESNLALHITFDKSSYNQTNIQDFSSKRQNGTFIGTNFNSVSGKYGEGIYFLGNNNYTNFNNNLNFNKNDFTISFYIKVPWTSALVSWNGIMGKGGKTSAPTNTWSISTNQYDGRKLNYRDVNDTIGDYNGILNSESLEDGWRHIVIMRNKSTYYLYVDNKLQDWHIANDISNLNNIAPFEIPLRGHNGNNAYFNGSIDELRIYNKALTKQEIENLYYFNNLNINLNNQITILDISNCNLINGQIYNIIGFTNSQKIDQKIIVK